jgi:hypothetical protein
MRPVTSSSSAAIAYTISRCSYSNNKLKIIVRWFWWLTAKRGQNHRILTINCKATEEAGSPPVPDFLQFLTAPYRRSSPPSLAEEPRLSPEECWASHGFLTQPIARQALLVAAPEHNRFAPVLA